MYRWVAIDIKLVYGEGSLHILGPKLSHRSDELKKRRLSGAYHDVRSIPPYPNFSKPDYSAHILAVR